MTLSKNKYVEVILMCGVAVIEKQQKSVYILRAFCKSCVKAAILSIVPDLQDVCRLDEIKSNGNSNLSFALRLD
jgi:hypothetical protein